MRLNLYFLFPLVALVILITALSSTMYQLPPLGKFVNPFIGLNQNYEEKVRNDITVNRGIMGIRDSVNIFFDERMVPHIFAHNDEDVYYAQGYVTAFMRLWQMDFLSYISAGRLSEIFGTRMLEFDRTQRRMGIIESAKKSLTLIEKDSTTNAVLIAYTRGINAYISELTYQDYPFEYKFFDYEPEPWTKLKTVLLMKHMGQALSGYEEDISMSHLYLALGDEDFAKLYPDFHDRTSPIIQDSVFSAGKFEIKKGQEYLNNAFIDSSPTLGKSNYNPKLGSNNWVVSGKKTRSGYPILCNDLHLNLTLPATWLEMQLCSNNLNVYGVSIPGTPSIIVGFNKDIAWGVTNGATDVKDWYKLKLSSDYRKYEFDKKMVDLEYVVEDIKIKGQKNFSDTVYYTIHGPIVMDEHYKTSPELSNFSLRWELNSPSNELSCFIKLNHAKNYNDYREAIKQFSCPVQNFAFASQIGDIGIVHQGSLTKKWNGQGKFILDGTKKSHLYSEQISQDSLPQLFNPPSGYIFSANQHPTNTSSPFYYNGYYSEVRANRIKKLLEAEDSFDIDKMKKMQLDNVNAFAEVAFPGLLEIIKNKRKERTVGTEYLFFQNWNGAYDGESKGAKYFELFWNNIVTSTWDELQQYSFYQRPPDDYVLLNMILNDPKNKYFDKQGTNKTEDASDIVYDAYINALSKVGEEIKGWSEYNKIKIIHPTNLDALGLKDIPMAGHPNAINAMSDNWGPTWRMVVEFGPERPNAYGVYPGGQSGNIGSYHYDDFVSDWKNGNYYQLHFYLNAKEASEALIK